jgi:hypothetical protein
MMTDVDLATEVLQIRRKAENISEARNGDLADATMLLLIAAVGIAREATDGDVKSTIECIVNVLAHAVESERALFSIDTLQ